MNDAERAGALSGVPMASISPIGRLMSPDFRRQALRFCVGVGRKTRLDNRALAMLLRQPFNRAEACIVTKNPAKPDTAQAPEAANTLPPIVDIPHVPLLYVDGCLNFGARNGIVNMTLAAERFIASGSKINNDLVIVAHLRMSIAAAQDLRTAIDNALLLAMEAPEGAKN